VLQTLSYSVLLVSCTVFLYEVRHLRFSPLARAKVCLLSLLRALYVDFSHAVAYADDSSIQSLFALLALMNISSGAETVFK
jgi:hypothetical protein